MAMQQQDDMRRPNDESANPAEDEQVQSGERRILRRSKQDRVLGGVCGGLGRYFDVEPVLFRIAFLVLLLPGGFGILLYIVSLLAIPEFRSVEDERRDSVKAPLSQRTAGTTVGVILIVMGGLILLERIVDVIDPPIVAAVALIIFGALFIWRGLRNGAAA